MRRKTLKWPKAHALAMQSGHWKLTTLRFLVVSSRPLAAGRDWQLYGKQFSNMEFGCVPSKDSRQIPVNSWIISKAAFQRSPMMDIHIPKADGGLQTIIVCSQ